jgi:hypothetical protein
VINFRYHLVSIVAVVLALGIGIVLGSGFLGGVLWERLQNDVQRVAEDNDELRAQMLQQGRTLSAYEEFARATEEDVIGGALAGREVALFTMEGTDETTIAGLRDAVEVAGGSVVTEIRATAQLALASPEARSELALTLGATQRGPNELRRELGIALGSAAAAASSLEPSARGGGPAAVDVLGSLLTHLVEQGFVAVESGPGEEAVPPLSLFLVVEGSAANPPLRPLTYTRVLATNLAQRDADVLVAEPSTSVWGVVGSLREDQRALATVSTVDQAETVPGRVAVVLGLSRAGRGRVGHYGTGPGAEDGLMPPPVPLAG